MTDSPHQIVLDVLAALRSGEFENLKPLLSESVVYEDPRVTRRGLVAIRQQFEADRQVFQDLESEVSRVTCEGRSVVVERTDHFTHDGQRVCLDIVATFDIDEAGKVANFVQSFDTARPAAG